MDALTGFGLVAVTAMLVTYALEARATIFVLGFAGACAMGLIYGFMQGASGPIPTFAADCGYASSECWN